MTTPGSPTPRSTTTRKPSPRSGSSAGPCPGSPPAASGSSGSSRQRFRLQTPRLARCLRRARHHPEEDSPLQTPDQRQDRTLPPHPRRRLGILTPLPDRDRPTERSPGMAASLQSPPSPHRHRNQTAPQQNHQPGWAVHLDAACVAAKFIGPKLRLTSQLVPGGDHSCGRCIPLVAKESLGLYTICRRSCGTVTKTLGGVRVSRGVSSWSKHRRRAVAGELPRTVAPVRRHDCPEAHLLRRPRPRL
jgi:hypothetical protein